MKTIGLIGGTSWLSTADYYRLLNQKIGEKLGRLNSAKIILHSVNFEEFKKKVDEDNTKWLSDAFCDIARKIEAAGAGCLALCANTPHKYAPDIENSIRIPLIHIAEAVASVIASKGITKVALLGTRITMTEDFFKDKLKEKGIETIIPQVDEMDFIHRTIFEELGLNIFKESTRGRYIEIIKRLQSQGAEVVILGCSEIPLLIKQNDSPIPVFDTTEVHADAIVKFALGIND
ncbi:MAG: aspartate/glutamate racemase family protein [Ignavibacteria bacterium]|nr:aspartate/glutamate racemase family protein [Ignavibacteria bacterium]